MIINGGVIFVCAEDQSLPCMRVNGAKVYIDLPEGFSKADGDAYLLDRMAPGSSFTDCLLYSREGWAKQRTNEALAGIRSSRQGRPIGVLARLKAAIQSLA